jgi:hypothetical protein
MTNALFQMSPVGVAAGKYIGHGKARHPGSFTLTTKTTVLVMLTPLQYFKGKGKVHPRTGHKGTEGEQTYSTILPSTLASEGG